MPLALVLILLSAAVFVALSALVVATKRQRDRDETRLAEARRGIREAVATVDGPRIARMVECARSDRLILDAILIESEIAEDAQAARACLRLGGPGRVAGFARTLASSRRPSRRARGALLAAAVPIDGAEDLLAGLLADRDRDVCLAAIRSLARIGSPAAAAHLVGALSTSPALRDPLTDALASPWAYPALSGALHDPRHASARPWLIEASGPAGRDRATTPLADFLATGSTEERIRAARSLGRGGDRGAAPLLVAALEDPEWPVRAQAATALGAIGADDPDTLGALARALEDSGWWVRANAATALIEAGPEGRRWLSVSLGSRDRFARERAREALDIAGMAGAG